MRLCTLLLLVAVVALCGCGSVIGKPVAEVERDNPTWHPVRTMPGQLPGDMEVRQYTQPVLVIDFDGTGPGRAPAGEWVLVEHTIAIRAGLVDAYGWREVAHAAYTGVTDPSWTK
jgi:hypothetical protein